MTRPDKGHESWALGPNAVKPVSSLKGGADREREKQITSSSPFHWLAVDQFGSKNLSRPSGPSARRHRTTEMANPIPRSAVLAVLALLFLLASPCLAASDVPFIVAHKKAALKRLKSGAERVLVSIDVYNQGSSWVLPPSNWIRWRFARLI